MAVRILTDSTASIKSFEVEEHKIEIVPLHVSFGEQEYRDGVDITIDQFYEKLQEKKDFPKTSQPSPDEFVKKFEAAKEANDDLIYLSISSGLSGTINSARLAKDIVDYDNIYVVDTLESIQGLRLLTFEAIRLRDEGKTAVEIVERIKSIQPRIRIFSMIDTLEYLYRGGRLSRAVALIGNMISLKPLIDLDEKGAIRMYGKTIGLNRAYKAIISSIEKNPIDQEFPVYFGFTDKDEHLLKLIEKVEEQFGKIKYDISQIGPAIGAHIGPGGFCAIYVTK